MKFFQALLVCLFLSTGLFAKEVIITLGGDPKAGEEKAKKTGGRWTDSFEKAIRLAFSRIQGGGAIKVTVQIAQGQYSLPTRRGGFTLPPFQNAEAVLCLQGGYNPQFTKRKPFHTPTSLIPPKRRLAGFFDFPYSSIRDQKELKGLILDGLLMDSSPSNLYHQKSGQLIKGRSSTVKALCFGYFRLQFLEINHCIFANFPHRTLSFLFRPASNQARIRLYNTVFLNCVIPLKVDTARYRYIPELVEVIHCSFLMNWPYNWDPATGNPAAVEISHDRAIKKVIFERNLFYANPGGALFVLYRSWPELVIKENNFVGNGFLFGELEKEGTALLYFGKKGRTRLSLSNLKTFKDAKIEGNVSIPPGLPLSFNPSGKMDPKKIAQEKEWDDAMARLLGETLKVNIYAQKVDYDEKNPPFPLQEKAKGYGASPDLVK